MGARDTPVLLVPCLRKRDMPAQDTLPDFVAKRYDALSLLKISSRPALVRMAISGSIDDEVC
jgi:hypothetical protein